jgi:hypothetical protein
MPRGQPRSRPLALLDRAHGRCLHVGGHPPVLWPLRRHQGREGLRPVALEGALEQRPVVGGELDGPEAIGARVLIGFSVDVLSEPVGVSRRPTQRQRKDEEDHDVHRSDQEEGGGGSHLTHSFAGVVMRAQG